jgi:hypothetical protein
LERSLRFVVTRWLDPGPALIRNRKPGAVSRPGAVLQFQFPEYTDLAQGVNNAEDRVADPSSLAADRAEKQRSGSFGSGFCGRWPRLTMPGRDVMKKTLGVLLIFVAGAIGLLIARQLIHTAPAPGATNVADQVGEGFKHIVAQMRPTLPKAIDAATTLVDVSTAGMVLTYRYTVDSENFELVPNFMRVAQRTTTSLICNTEDMKAAMKAGAVYEYRYSDANSRSLGGFVVTKADCE